MDKNANLRVLPRSWRFAGWGALALLLALPAVAMRFTSEVEWSGSDFATAAALLIALGAGIELTIRHAREHWQCVGLVVSAASAFLTIWLSGAVGIIGDQSNPLNRGFVALLAIGSIAGAVVRFRPQPMAVIAGTLAAGQLLLVATAIGGRIADWQPALIFVTLWILAALCFHLSGSGTRRR